MTATTNAVATKRDLAEVAMRRCWFPIARTCDLATPQPATLLGVTLVAYRDGRGRAVVQSRRCPHRGGDLSGGQVRGGSIACPYHGWEFASDSGVCTRIPSLPDQSKIPPRAGIVTYPVVERFGHVWTVLETPIREMYEVDEWAGLDLQWLAAEPLESPVGVGVAIENFRDVAHFPFVHRVSMGPSPEVVEPLTVTREGLNVWMDRALDAGAGDWARDGDCLMHYRCSAPGFSSITYYYDQLGTRIVTGFPSPVSYEEVIIFWAVACEVGFKGSALDEQLRVEELVFREDLPVVKHIEPREIPWDREFHEFSVPADRFTLNYRRAFKELMQRVTDARGSRR
jgi:phenylpropionate dioxygenase-like ring-hydroxylating dioxygenase large terminal subunit